MIIRRAIIDNPKIPQWKRRQVEAECQFGITVIRQHNGWVPMLTNEDGDELWHGRAEESEQDAFDAVTRKRDEQVEELLECDQRQRDQDEGITDRDRDEMDRGFDIAKDRLVGQNLHGVNGENA